MSVIWQKVWYDLWHYKARTLLAIVSITTGVLAVGVVFGMADLLLSGMDAAHRAVNPAHLTIYLNRPVDRETALSVRKVPGVLDVEPANTIGGTYRLHAGGEWKQAQLVVRDDYERQHTDVVELKAGQWPHAERIAIERLSSAYFGAGIGDAVTFKIGDEERTYQIDGVVRHPFVPPPQFGGAAYFFLSPQALERFGIAPDTFTGLFIRTAPYSADGSREIAAEIKDRLGNQGIGVGATMYQDPEKHWGRMYIEGITVVMRVLAIVVLGMSVVLVFNTLSALVKQQTNQIGILKAIGARSSTILRVYLSGVAIYGLLALPLALPLGMYLAWSTTAGFLALFNIEYNEFSWSDSAVALQIASATAVPLLAGLVPALAGARTTVREAIASYGLGDARAGGRLDALLGRVAEKFLPSHYVTSLTNLFRRRGRLLLTQAVLVGAGTMFLSVMSISESLTLTLDNVFARRKFDVMFYVNNRPRIDRLAYLAAGVEGIDAVEVWSVMPATLERNGVRAKEAGLGVELDGVEPASGFFRELVVAGRWLQGGDQRALVLNRETAEKNGIRVGDTVTLDLTERGKSDWEVVGLYQIVFNGGFSPDTMYAPRQAVFEATKQGGRGSVMLVRTADRARGAVDAVVQELKTRLEDQSIRLAYVMTEHEFRLIGDSQNAMSISMLLTLAVMVAIVGGFGLAGALSLGVVERTKEIGVLRAIGARSRTIFGMCVLEGQLQGTLSWLLSVGLSLVVSQPMADALGQAVFHMPLDYRYNWSAVGVWFAVVAVIATIASVLPARSATRIRVRDSLEYA